MIKKDPSPIQELLRSYQFEVPGSEAITPIIPQLCSTNLGSL